jgi:hypothetical protein
MTWRVHCRLFGPSAEARWFVARDLLSGAATEYVTNQNGRPLPFSTEEAADQRAAELNAAPLEVTVGGWSPVDVGY